MKRLFAGLAVVLSVAPTACGGGSSPTQPTVEDGCRIVGADPVSGSVLKAGVPVNVTLTGRCTLNAAASATVVASGIMLPSSSSTPTATRAISKGTTTVSLTILFTPPASETSVGFLMGIVYDAGVGLPPTGLLDSVDYKIG